MTFYEYCLKEQRSELLEEWDVELNGELTANPVSSGSNRKMWWICQKQHRWQASVKSRVQGNGCPVCAGRALLEGVNDLRSCYPELSGQWNEQRNGSLKPEKIRYNSTQRVWWRCEQGHEWQAGIKNRVNGSGCPVCRGQQIAVGENDLASCFPDIAAQWHPTRNGDLTAQNVRSYSKRRVWWHCEQGHEWQAVVYSRTHDRTTCPVCAGRQLQRGCNDLASCFPDIAAQWHLKKNGVLRPEMILAGSHKKVWWQDAHGHAWQATVDSRTSGNHGCPYCSGQKVLTGFNDLATLEPLLARQWHPVRNGNLTPDKVMVGARKKVWWTCSEGHEWQAMVYARSGAQKTGCPYCANKGKRYHTYQFTTIAYRPHTLSMDTQRAMK